MVEDRKARYEAEKKAKAYKDFMDYAVREIANEVIRSGFRELRGVVERILQVYHTLPK